MDNQFIRNQIVGQIEKVCCMPMAQTGCSDTEDLLKAGLLDSVAFLELFLFLGKSFDIPILDGDIANPSHSTIAGMCSLVQMKKLDAP